MKKKASLTYKKAVAAVKAVDKAILVAERAFKETDSIGTEEVLFAFTKAQDAMKNCEKLLDEA
jgi:hypothetical protein